MQSEKALTGTKLKIKVTKDIIMSQHTCRRQGNNCAVALAVQDLFPLAHVTYENIYPFAYLKDSNLPEIRGNFLKIPIPIEARSFIVAFDNSDRALLPEIEFEISIPDEVIEKINIDEIKLLLQNHPTLELIEN